MRSICSPALRRACPVPLLWLTLLALPSMAVAQRARAIGRVIGGSPRITLSIDLLKSALAAELDEESVIDSIAVRSEGARYLLLGFGHRRASSRAIRIWLERRRSILLLREDALVEVCAADCCGRCSFGIGGDCEADRSTECIHTVASGFRRATIGLGRLLQ